MNLNLSLIETDLSLFNKPNIIMDKPIVKGITTNGSLNTESAITFSIIDQ